MVHARRSVAKQVWHTFVRITLGSTQHRKMSFVPLEFLNLFQRAFCQPSYWRSKNDGQGLSAPALWDFGG